MMFLVMADISTVDSPLKVILLWPTFHLYDDRIVT